MLCSRTRPLEVQNEKAKHTNMAITHIGPDAFATMGMCEEAKKPFGITIDPKGKNLNFVWAFKIDKEKAHREHFDEKHVNGSISIDENFPGCPYCGSKQFIICGNCGTISCYHGQKQFTCPNCGAHGEVTTVDSIDIKGGGF
ncbi:hypothetical protein PRLR6025_25840 [Prevotella lacticifex]|jgi:hypothetical protein|nr:hypothetical protein PRLR6025_25840 [Prevotella lacticifex]